MQEFSDTASNHSLSTAGFVNPLAGVSTSACTEFTIFPPPGAAPLAVPEPPSVHFEPLPDIRPRASLVPEPTPLRPAAFSSAAPAPCELLGQTLHAKVAIFVVMGCLLTYR